MQTRTWIRLKCSAAASSTECPRRPPHFCAFPSSFLPPPIYARFWLAGCVWFAFYRRCLLRACAVRVFRWSQTNQPAYGVRCSEMGCYDGTHIRYEINDVFIFKFHVAGRRGLLRQLQCLKCVACRRCMRKQTSRSEVVPHVLCH